ncbi:MAG: asparagine--tRNA ligase [Cyclobacteriaceae bacterium]|nr:asparagine--tRNA ligase [Cyclobacteriaceae bacterium]MCH8515542.1 asparagine--tRNA ligase [Cyclobacteriaceae bacterium]
MSAEKRVYQVGEKIKALLSATALDREVILRAWVRNKRGNKHVAFISANDGSCLSGIQVVADVEKIGEDLLKEVTVGSAIWVKGQLVASAGKGQQVEVVAEEVRVLGGADAEKYPIQPKKHSLEFLREQAHLRVRTSTFGAVFRIRHAMSYAVHHFFNSKGFFNVHSPILTATDAEGAGEMFRVTNLNLKDLPRTDDGEIDYSQDFFGRPTNLTVSGQLEAELLALGLGEVYTFGPTFRAENSNTSRHLAEFWMIEPEMAFAELSDNIALAQEFLQYLVNYALDNCREDLAFLDQRLADEEKNKKKEEKSEMGLIEKLEFVANNDFKVLTYTEAIEILRNSKPNKKKQFNYLIDEWGADLQSEHERYLVEKHFKMPVVLKDYPKDIKAFYMRQNDDGKTVAAMDVLFPGIGEIIGGSQREERLDKLTRRMEEMDVSQEELWWFLETRKFGTVPHAGFGLGFERLMLFVTGMTNIRDVIPFPRFPDHAEF